MGKEGQSYGMDRREFLAGAVAGATVVGLGTLTNVTRAEGAAPFALPALPYPEDALEPYISRRTVGFHYGKHHSAYVTKTNELVQGTPLAERPLEDIIAAVVSDEGRVAVFNNAAQTWNHTFYWNCMKPGGGGEPKGPLGERIAGAFGSTEKFRQVFSEAALTQFGSGWAWLVLDGGALKVVKTGNADTPIARGQKPLLTVDVWEHAYYLDYQNRRKDYITDFLTHLVNWDFVAGNLAQA